MQRLVLVIALLSQMWVSVSCDCQSLPGQYCECRTQGNCCPDRDDECTMPIYRGPHSSLCYCDEFCYKHHVEDCCPDYQRVCRGVNTPPTHTKNKCTYNGSHYMPGQTVIDDCNQWKCVKEFDAEGQVEHYGWQKDNDACVNSDDLLSRLSYIPGWDAQKYDKFRGMKLKDAVKYFLGTKYPKQNVRNLNPLNIDPSSLPPTFDSRNRWRIHKPMDQGMCAASWAFSTIGVASDRWGIHTNGGSNDLLSVQSLICNALPYTKPCQGNTVEAGWDLLHKNGSVSDQCYPYEHMSGVGDGTKFCKNAEDIKCPNGQRAERHPVAPAHRIKQDQAHIMQEIQNDGPVQAIIKVRADFFLYKSGVYSYSGVPEMIQSRDYTLEGIHSVKIIGWGEERGIKYWLAANSWGQNWGEGGYFKIKRGENESKIEEFVVAVWANAKIHQVYRTQRRHHAHRFL